MIFLADHTNGRAYACYSVASFCRVSLYGMYCC